MRNFSYTHGELIAVRGDSAFALIDDRGASSEATFGLMAAVGSGNPTLLVEAARFAAAELSSVGVAWRGDDALHVVIAGHVGAIYESPRATHTAVARQGCYEFAVPEDVERVELAVGFDGEGQRGELGGAAVRAATVAVQLTETVASPTTPVADGSGIGAVSAINSDGAKEDRSEGVPEGVVAGTVGGVASSDETVPEIGPSPGPHEEAASTARVRLVDLASSDEAALAPLALPGDAVEPAISADAVQVLGVRCPVDHHNHPNALYCSQCGRRMGVNHTAVVLPGPRPPLGLFLIDDVATYAIASDVVVGRDPASHPGYNGDGAILTLEDEELQISRAHVEIRLDGWDVTARDLGSANGTKLRREGTDQWAPLSTEIPATLGAGDVLRIGPRELQLELHHVQT